MKIYQLVLKILSGNKSLAQIKDHNPGTNVGKMTCNYPKLDLVNMNEYRSTSLCQTCLSRIHGICRSDHPFPSISPILLCISNMFMSNLVITKSRLYRSGFSFPKISFLHLHHYLCRSKFCVGQKFKKYKCQTK